jgi:hypothetical protein
MHVKKLAELCLRGLKACQQAAQFAGPEDTIGAWKTGPFQTSQMPLGPCVFLMEIISLGICMTFSVLFRMKMFYRCPL